MNPHSYRLKGRDFVHQGKIEIDVNERAVFIRTQGCFFVYTNSDCFLNSWENEKSYPDIHSLLLLSSLFNVSLDQLIKGDIEKMKEIISEQEIKKFNYYGSIYTVHLAVLIISAVPLFMWLGRYAYIPFGILFIITMYWALKVEKLKKKNDIQTYKEIVAFTEGKKLDELHKAVEVGKRPYQNILKVIISAGVTAMICFLIGVLMHVFLN